jgi:hypothetical protein
VITQYIRFNLKDYCYTHSRFGYLTKNKGKDDNWLFDSSKVALSRELHGESEATRIDLVKIINCIIDASLSLKRYLS